MSDNRTNKEKEDLKKYWADKKAEKKAKKASKAWYKKPIFIFLWVILGLFILAAIFGSTDETLTTKQTSDQPKAVSSDTPKQAEEQVPSIGDKVRDGKFEFVVTKIKCGEKSVGDEFLKEEAQGQFCRLSLSIKNIGNEPQSLYSGDQYLYDANENKYSADDTATLYAGSGSSGSTWYEEINPGNSVKGDILFDVPKTVKPSYVELHDSSFSNGVKVKL